METVWFCLVAVMIAMYVVLDGSISAAGAVHLFVGAHGCRAPRRLRSIGPVWDGNEVWLLAGGGTLYFAFPALYASSFSGFYLPLNGGALAADSARHRHRIPRARCRAWSGSRYGTPVFGLASAAAGHLSSAPLSATSFVAYPSTGPALFSCRCGPISPSAKDAGGILDW